MIYSLDIDVRTFEFFRKLTKWQLFIFDLQNFYEKFPCFFGNISRDREQFEKNRMLMPNTCYKKDIYEIS